MEVRCKQHSSARGQSLLRSQTRDRHHLCQTQAIQKDSSKSFDVEMLSWESQRSSYQSELRNQLEHIPNSDDLNIIWGSLKRATIKAAANTLGYTRHGRKPWISIATIEQHIKGTKCGKETKDLCLPRKKTSSEKGQGNLSGETSRGNMCDRQNGTHT